MRPVSHRNGRIDHVPESSRSQPTKRSADVPAQPTAPPEDEQLSFPGMPERLFVATPSKLGAFEDCPRRYRYSYVDRPTPPKGPPWAHNSLGASVHTALKNWFGLARDRRTPAALPGLLGATWVAEGYRDDAQEAAVRQRALGWLRTYVDRLDPAFEPVGVERVVAAKTGVLALNGRADRIDRHQPGPDDARGSSALALYAFASTRVFRRACHVVELHHLPSETVAAHRHTDESLARAVGRAEAMARDIQAAEAALRSGADPDEAFPTAPGTLCGYCDFRRVCTDGQAAGPAKDPWVAVDQPS
jgi:hypothetical protein